MKQIVIIGAGGFGREVQWLIERINAKNITWQLKGYIDDAIEAGTLINGYPVLGGIDYLLEMEDEIAVVCAIGSSKIRKKIVEKIANKDNIEFPNLIDPHVQMSNYIELGVGNIICAGSILTVNISIGDFTIVNLDCTVGHDVILNSFVTVYPSVNISGCVKIGESTEIGTGTKIIQGKTIGDEIIIGAGAVVVKDLEISGTYVGVPVKAVKYKDGEKK